MLNPNKTKYRKPQRGRKSQERIARERATRNNTLSYGNYGLQIKAGCEMTSRQIEAARRVIARETKRDGKIWIKVFPHKAITSKGDDIPMGKGKGSPDFFVASLKAGTVIFELAGIKDEVAKEALMQAGHKLPVPCKVISKNI